MGAAARHRGDALLRRQADDASRASAAHAHRDAWAEVALHGWCLDQYHLDCSVWYEANDGTLFAFSKFEVVDTRDIRPTAQRYFAYWCREHGLSPSVLYPLDGGYGHAPYRPVVGQEEPTP